MLWQISRACVWVFKANIHGQKDRIDRHPGRRVRDELPEVGPNDDSQLLGYKALSMLTTDRRLPVKVATECASDPKRFLAILRILHRYREVCLHIEIVVGRSIHYEIRPNVA